MAAISATLLLVFMVGLSLVHVHAGIGVCGPRYYVPGSEDGWHGLGAAHWLLVVTILAAFALLASQAGRRAPAVPVTLSFLVTLLAGLSTIWLIVRVVIDPPGGRNAGGWLALISATVLTWSGYKSMRMEGIAPEDEPDLPTVDLADLPPPAEGVREGAAWAPPGRAARAPPAWRLIPRISSS